MLPKALTASLTLVSSTPNDLIGQLRDVKIAVVKDEQRSYIPKRDPMMEPKGSLMRRIERVEDPLPSERVQAVAKHVASVLPKIIDAKAEDEMLDAISQLFGGLTDVLSVPVFQQAMALGMMAGARDAAKQMRATGQMSALHLVGLRKSAGITQEELARHLGQPQTNISKWERGLRPIPKKHVPAILDLLVGRGGVPS
jgi:DNA-binding transcriptional regulator YiaG